MRMSAAQIREAVALMQVSDEERAVILEQALSGNPSARFAVYAAWKRGVYNRLSSEMDRTRKDA